MSSQTQKFYENIGWKREEKTLVDLQRWEDLRLSSAAYKRHSELRIVRHIPNPCDQLLDVGCGPLINEEIFKATLNCTNYHCIDFSQDALLMASEKLGSRGTYQQTDFLSPNLVLPSSHFDCVLCLSCLFHEDKNRQDEFVRKMLAVAKPGAPVIVSYANPNDFISSNHKWSQQLDRLIGHYESYAYYFIHSLSWWKRFEAEATVELHPLRSIRSVDQKRLIPDGQAGSIALEILTELEDRHPSFFIENGHYYFAVLRRR